MVTKKVGYIKQHRTLMDTPIWQWPSTRFKIYACLYMMANWQANKWTFRGREYDLQPGQLVTSYENIVKEAKSKDITYKIVRTTCRKLAEEGYIKLETVYKTSVIITLIDWQRTQGQIETGTETGTELDTTGTELENPEKVDIKGYLTGGDSGPDIEREQKRAQNWATIEEDLKNKEEGKGSKDDPPSHSNVKILKAYYQLYEKYTKKPAAVKFKRDSKILDNHNINEKETEQVIRNLEQWFKDADTGTVKKLYPLGFFCSQYDEIENVTNKQRTEYIYMGEPCPKCNKTINYNKQGEKEPHRCKFSNFCNDCRVAWSWYEGETEPKHDCKQYREKVNKEQGYQYFKDV